MNRLTTEKRAQVIACLVEGNSIRATVRITGVAKNTVTKLLTDMGLVCSNHMDREMRAFGSASVSRACIPAHDDGGVR